MLFRSTAILALALAAPAAAFTASQPAVARSTALSAESGSLLGTDSSTDIRKEVCFLLVGGV